MPNDYELIEQERYLRLMANCIRMLDFHRLVNLAFLLQSCRAEGALVEFGCAEGHTAAFLSSLCHRPVYLYDSFCGLPDRTPEDLPGDDRFNPGDFATSPEAVTQLFIREGLPEPYVVKGWFNTLCPEQIPQHIAFAHIDADRYASTMTALEWVYPRMAIGGVCVIDDYDHPNLPGVASAVNQYTVREKLSVRVERLQCWFVNRPGTQ